MMPPMHWIYWILFGVCLVTCLPGVRGLIAGVRFLHDVRRAVRDASKLRDADGRFRFQPRCCVILPCCGVDEHLEQTIRRLAAQNYETFEVIFTFESADDPAYAAIERWTADWTVPHRRVIAGLTTNRSQKVHNLLAAVATVGPECEALVFLDSDAVPNSDWLGFMVAPLADDRPDGTRHGGSSTSTSTRVGATTGFRWYGTSGGFANVLRSVWNAPSLTLMEDARTRFCWGGATAMLRTRFDELGITRLWEGALSDDLQVTRAVRSAGLEIVFVPQALIPSHDRTTPAGFWNFARRQLVITRIGAPGIWRAGLLLCMSFVLGGTIAAVLCLGPILGWFGNNIVAALGGVFWAAVLVFAVGRSVLRQLAIRKVLHPPDLTWRDAWWDITGAIWSGMLHMLLFAASATGRRLQWRHTVYEMISPTETRVLARHGGSSTPAPRSPAPLHV